MQLARWFDEHFELLEKIRSYARLSRRQSATPDIPRPRWTPSFSAFDDRTFAVILDTSGPMTRSLPAKPLSMIAGYAASRDVVRVRVVFCDAAVYDQGHMPPEEMAGKVKIRGRGGTVIQPAVNLLKRDEGFPKDGPILIITDGDGDRLRVRREHSFVLPKGRHSPFAPKGKVFYIR